MSSVTLLRALWRHRIGVTVIALVAMLSGGLLAYRPSFPPQRRGYDVGVATASILVDTPKSQVIEVAPRGSETLGTRATLVANLMVDGEIKAIIARRAGLPTKRLRAASQAPDAASPLTGVNARSYAYTTSAAVTPDMTTLPIIKVQAQAPNVPQAIALANDVVAGLGEYLDRKASNETVSNARRLRVRALGTAQGHEAARGPGRIMGLLVFVVVLLVGCTILLALDALARGWRAAAADEAAGEYALFEPDEENWTQPSYGERASARAS